MKEKCFKISNQIWVSINNSLIWKEGSWTWLKNLKSESGQNYYAKKYNLKQQEGNYP